MAWPAPGPVRGRPAPRLPGWAIGAWGLVVLIPPGWAVGWRSGLTGCSRTTPTTIGGSPGRSPLAAPAGGRPVRPPPALLRPVGRSARAIPGPLPLRDPPHLGGATPSRALPRPPWPRSAEAWRRSPAAHPGSARPAPRRRPCPGAAVSDPCPARRRLPSGVPASDPNLALFRRPQPRALLPLATLRLIPRAALVPLPTGRRPGPTTPPSPCSAGNARPPPRGPHRWRRSLRRRGPLPRAGRCPDPPGAARRLPHRSGTASPLQLTPSPCPFLQPARFRSRPSAGAYEPIRSPYGAGISRRPR
jgi:hypothetical protein